MGWVVSQRSRSSWVSEARSCPYYVSDAGLADVADCMRELLSSKGEGRFVGERLREAAAAGRLRVRADAFFYAPFDFTALSEGLGRSSRRPL